MAADDGLSLVLSIRSSVTVVSLLQETQERFPKLGQMEIWDELGSGEEEGSSTDCDDEDGCQASGDGQSQNCESHRKCPDAVLQHILPHFVWVRFTVLTFMSGYIAECTRSWPQSHFFFGF